MRRIPYTEHTVVVEDQPAFQNKAPSLDFDGSTKLSVTNIRAGARANRVISFFITHRDPLSKPINIKHYRIQVPEKNVITLSHMYVYSGTMALLNMVWLFFYDFFFYIFSHGYIRFPYEIIIITKTKTAQLTTRHTVWIPLTSSKILTL